MNIVLMMTAMHRYKNLNNDSGITDYEIGDDFIRVRFEGPSQYLYTFTTPGRTEVEDMKKLAQNGRGLATYINQFVRARYAKREL